MKLLVTALISLLPIIYASAQDAVKTSLDKATLLRCVIAKRIGVFEMEGLTAEQMQKYIAACLADEEYENDRNHEYDGKERSSKYFNGIKNALGSQAEELDRSIKKESISNQMLRSMKLERRDKQTGKPLDEQLLEIKFEEIVWLSMLPDLDEGAGREFKLKEITSKPVDAIIERLTKNYKDLSTIVLSEDLAKSVNEQSGPLLQMQFERLRKLSDRIEATVSAILK